MSNNQVQIFDTTLRDGEQSPGASLNIDEKVEIARQLERLGVDIIEAGFPISSPGDFEAVRRVAATVSDRITICGLTRAVPKDIDVAWDALKGAKRPRIHTGLGVSDNHLQHKLKKTREQAMEIGVNAVKYAKSLGCEDIEYFTEDSGRADKEYLYRVIEAVIKAGATVINIPDTTGYMSPEEYGALFAGVLNHVPGSENIILSAHCHNDLGMATANSLAAVKAGARQVECTINGIGERAGNTSLEEVVMALHTRRDIYQVQSNIVTTEIYKTSRLVSTLTGILVQPNKAIVGANAFAHSSGIHQDGILKQRDTYEIIDPATVGISESKIILSARSGRHALRDRLSKLGHEFPNDTDFERVYARFLNVADSKKVVYDEDLDAIVSDETSTAPQAFELVQVQVSCGDHAIPTATVKLRNAEKAILLDADTGNGPVDAIYRAINRIVQVPNDLIEYTVQSVTEGIDAMADVTIRIKAEGDMIYTGHSAHTDIFVASTKAYLQALNKQIARVSGRKQEERILEHV
ncbi:2-isopropylmalate synthase [Capsulimonas corticalis]|uniref:2-isopropylmalate synthase n=1 Tax=Capsulimonas corticalis TaxID=2219043 RepID=A0A402CY35_9BACT|nr:2-isopropylmalate synthase [Capsulimonas corticalis]BDI31451.1 2-isopropylmalate synthase [Capsulimonas corticalis]